MAIGIVAVELNDKNEHVEKCLTVPIKKVSEGVYVLAKNAIFTCLDREDIVEKLENNADVLSVKIDLNLKIKNEPPKVHPVERDSGTFVSTVPNEKLCDNLRQKVIQDVSEHNDKSITIMRISVVILDISQFSQ